MPWTALDPASARVIPWKNGGGSTLELAIAPAGAGLEDFAWRISSARVAASGSFSRFAGIDRSLALLSGKGLCLQRADGQVDTLQGSAIVAFAGEEAISAQLQDGPITDLNVMTRRGRWRHRLASLPVRGSQAVDNDAEVLLLWNPSSTPLTVEPAGGARCQLAAGCGLLLEHEPGRLQLVADSPALLYLAWLYQQRT